MQGLLQICKKTWKKKPKQATVPVYICHWELHYAEADRHGCQEAPGDDHLLLVEENPTVSCPQGAMQEHDLAAQWLKHSAGRRQVKCRFCDK